MLNRLLPNRRSRQLTASAALAALAVLAIAGPASAAVTASTITSPANDASFIKDPGDASQTAFTVSGTTTGPGNVDINCYSSSTRYAVATDVPVTNGTFSQAITHSALPDATCVLRAVDTGDTTFYGPGSTTSFPGPTLALNYAYPNTQTVGDTTSTLGYEADFYAAAGSGTTGRFNLYSADQGGLEFGTLELNGAESGESDTVLAEDGALFTNPGDTDQDGNPFPVAIKVDGTAAQIPGFADASFTGFEGMTFTDLLSDGNLTIEEQDPLMFCESGPASCTSAGVELDRTWQTADSGLLIYQSDVFKSTDGAAHSVQAVEIDEFDAGPDGDTFDLPGTGGFASYAYAQAVTLPSGSGIILIKSDADTPEAGDQTHPQGAVVYGTAPGGPVSFLFGSAANHYSAFDMPYDVSVPASASAPALSFAYVQDFALTDVQTLAQQALASFSQSGGTPTGSSSGSAPGGDGAQPTQGSGAPASAKPAPKSLGTKVKPSTAKKFPYRYAVTGKITLPAGVTTTQGCVGKVTLTVKRGKTNVASTSATVNAKCAWSAKLTLRKRKLVPGRSGKLAITAAFYGNNVLNTYTAKPLTIRYRKTGLVATAKGRALLSDRFPESASR
jgi:hypothetical protein